MNPARLQESFPTWLSAADEVVTQYGDMAASLAAEFFEAERDAAGVPEAFTPEMAGRPPPEQVEASLRWAAHGIWTPDTDVQVEPLEVRLDAAQRQAEAVAHRLVLDQGRETIRQAVR